jgi:hypothetical protein
MHRALLLGVCCLSALAQAQETPWETVVTGPITIKNRALPNSALKELWAEGDLDASAREVQAVLIAGATYREFMPYVVESKQLSERTSEGDAYVYTMIDLPVVGKRDYVVRLWLEESVDTSATGTFKSRWTAAPDYLPRKDGVARLTVNTGSWVVTPTGDGTKCHAIYRFAVDPGGWVPTFAINLGNEKGVVETFRAVERQVKRLRQGAAH